MAQTKVKKKPAGKAAPKKAARAKPAPKKAPAKKAAKPAVKAKAPAKTTKAKPVKAAKASKAVAKKAPARKAAPAPVAKSAKAKRPVAVSHRPQSAVAVQSRPAKAATSAPAPAAEKRARPAASSESASGVLTEDQVRKAPDSAYMNDAQLAFFQERLLQMRAEVLTRELDVKERLHQREVFADPADRASAEEEHWLDLRLRERESLLLKKIDDALRRIRDREYGYCEKTGEPIGIARLLARPTATVCVDIKGQAERAESQYRDR